MCNFDNDTGTEELAHMEMICAIVHQLTKNLSPEEIERSGFAPYYVDHTLALWPQAASGAPWTATYFQSKVIRLQIFMKTSLQMVQLHKCNIEVLSRSSI